MQINDVGENEHDYVGYQKNKGFIQKLGNKNTSDKILINKSLV